ncbi:MAG: DNA primase [Candidatus Thioglobus sp.]|nr:MAG: DNA primase [Candidatus Thioglobus sp.]
MPYISQSFIDDLPNQIDIVDLVSKRLSLKKTGSDYRAPCPFHGGKNRNFAINSHKQFYHCFKCGESGGAISFVQKFDNLDFVEAIEVIAGEFGLKIEYDSNTKPVDPRLERYRDLSQKVSAFYIQQLRNSPAKEKAVSYAKNRGVSGEIAKRFELGFATPSNNDLLLEFEKNEQDTSDLKSLGLLKTGQYGDYDFFRDRLMFPIHNTKGKVIAFGGRAFDNKAKAKYLNSSESPIFSKSRELYGLYQARKHSRTMDYVLVVEGYMDVVALHQADFTKVVATLGTATTPEHLQILARTTNTIVFCFDGDNAGRAAAWKALQIALPIIKAGLVIKFLFLPDGEDPDTLVKKESTKAFEMRIEKAHTLSKFLFDHVKAEVDFDTIEGKTLFLEKVSVLINQVNYEIYQQQLIDGVAQVVGQSVDQVQTIFKQRAEQVISTSFDTIPVIDNEPPMPDFSDFSNDYQASNPEPQENSAVKVLMSKMISLLLNYPSLAYENDTVEVRVRALKKNDKKFEALLDLVHSAEMVEGISQEELLKPFKSKIGVYNRLQQLRILEPYFSENEAKNEFLDALLKVEGQQKKTQSLLIKDEKEYAKNLQARRGKKD